MFNSSASAFWTPVNEKLPAVSASQQAQKRNKTFLKGCDLTELDCVRGVTPEMVSVAMSLCLKSEIADIQSETKDHPQSLESFVGFQNGKSIRFDVGYFIY